MLALLQLGSIRNRNYIVTSSNLISILKVAGTTQQSQGRKNRTGGQARERSQSVQKGENNLTE